MKACTKPPNYAIIMEYCMKGSLWSLLQNTSIPLPWE
jgi:serine/threonine protein kinase